MKNWLVVLAVCLLTMGATGCAETFYDDPPVYVTVSSGLVEFCDDLGCRLIDAPYYYVDGEVVYWDAHFGCWIGPRGYWASGRWHAGFVVGYHGWYRAEHYHYVYQHPVGWRAGSGYHGYHRGRR